jgi:hypothetical protein
MALFGVCLWICHVPLIVVYSQAVPQEGCTYGAGDDYYGVGLPIAEAERGYRAKMRQQYPDWDEDTFNRYLEYGQAKQRERVVRKQALCLQMRDKYPAMSKEEREMLIEDESARLMAKEALRNREAVPA